MAERRMMARRAGESEGTWEPAPARGARPSSRRSLLLTARASRMRHLASLAGHAWLLAVTASSAAVVLFIFYFILKDALPFFRLEGLAGFFTSTRWYPSGDPPEFGALAILAGSALVTLSATAIAVPLGVMAAVCLSDVLPWSIRQALKPVIEILAAIPSVAYGFFALVVFAPLLQERGGALLAAFTWVLGLPAGVLAVLAAGDILAGRMGDGYRGAARAVTIAVLGPAVLIGLYLLSARLGSLQIASGTNALNVSVILAIMALPTIVSVSEDALQAAGRELREGSYALGATRAETIGRVVLPAAGGGILAAVILGMMRAIGETMVVWMASGNAAQVPRPLYNLLEPVRTLTATIAGDMGEADQLTGSTRYHVLFVMALVLLAVSFASNLASEWIVLRSRLRRAD